MNLVSRPMLIGFVPAAGILIVASQVPAVCGLPAHGSTLHGAILVLARPWLWDPAAIAFALGTAGLIILGRRVHALFPGILLPAGAAIIVSEVADYAGATVGAISVGLPPVSASMVWHSTPSLLLPAFVIAVIGFTEAAAIARTYAVIDRRPWSPNREFLAQSVANVTSSLAGGFPVGTSFSRSALNRLAGAKTSLSSAITGTALLLFIPFAGVLAPLPLAVLGATVIVAVASLLRPGPLRRLFTLSRPQFGIAAVTFVATLALEIDLAAVGRIDLSRALAVRALVQDATTAGLTVHVTHPPPRAARLVTAVISARTDLE